MMHVMDYGYGEHLFNPSAGLGTGTSLRSCGREIAGEICNNNDCMSEKLHGRLKDKGKLHPN
jgi:hypothetical protein